MVFMVEIPWSLCIHQVVAYTSRLHVYDRPVGDVFCDKLTESFSKSMVKLIVELQRLPLKIELVARTLLNLHCALEGTCIRLSAPHRCVCVCVCDGHLALPVATSLRCDSWQISCCFVQ